MAVEDAEKPCTIVLHDDRVSTVDILAGPRVMHVGEVAWLSASGARTLCICPAGAALTSNEISIHVSLASKFGFENRTPGRIRMIEDTEAATATHVELLFRDQYLNSADMWQLMKCVQHTVVYKGQIMKYLGSITAEVKNVWITGKELDSAFCSHPETKAIFRSASARFTLLIEVSREMLEGWSQGELMYERLIYGFLWDLFHRWESAKVKHQVSVVLFGRSLVAPGEPKRASAGHKQNDDFFYVLASEVPSSSWAEIIQKLKAAFNDLTLSRAVSLASASNMLEAIHLTAMDYADFYTDAHVMSTGTSIVAITAGTGLFDANHELLKQTTDLLVGNSIGVDIVALSPKPLHPVPLFKYDHEGVIEYALPHWVDISFWRSPNDEPQSTWTLPDTEEPVHDIALPLMQDSGFSEIDASVMDFYDNQLFSDEPIKRVITRASRSSPPTESVGSAETVKMRLSTSGETKKSRSNPTTDPVNIPPGEASPVPSKEPLNRAKRQRLPPHPLMQTGGRKISVGPKGLAISRGAASTTVSAEHAQQEKDLTFGTSVASNNSSGGLAKAIRASLARKPSQQSLVSQRISEPDEGQTSRPINIQSYQPGHDENGDLASIIEQGIEDTLGSKTLQNDTSLSATPKAGANFGSRPKRDSTHESLDMLSPWVMLLNPCNPTRDNMRVASQYRKWQHVFPRAVSTGTFKWSGMCTPAELPLTAEYKPSGTELEVYYRKKVKLHNISSSSGLREESANILVERLIDVRLVRGFQIVAIRHASQEQTEHKEQPVLLSLGRHYHQIQRFSDFQVQIVQYEPKAGVGSEDKETQHYLTSYEPKMRLSTGAVVRPEVTYHSEAPIADWTPLDEHILGLAPMPDINAKFRVRLILVPVDVHRGDNISRLGGLSDEERRIEGIQRLTQMWQRQRYFSSEDQAHQISVKKAASTPYTAIRDPNPLAIEYQTRDPSVVVNAHGPALLSQLEEGEFTTPLFSDAEKHHSSNFDMSKLVKQMQEPPPNGIEVRDRRWLTLTHLKCFRGDEMTTWLLGAFKDLELREDAVAVGNELMSRGVFSHVRQKHKFRDGHYFYQISSAYRTSEYPDTQGLFSKAPWRSIPPTPIAESVKSPVVRPVSGISTGNSSSSSDKGTPGLYPVEQKQILLSQVMQFNVDPQRKSNHLQIIELHYDRIHNPENCYHIQLEWLGTSPKFIREALSRWSSLVEGYGLRLTQVPLDEASRYREHHPFDQPQSINLVIKPPDKVLATPLLEPHTFSPRMVEDKLAYHKRVLKKMDFVLDYEAANAFTTSLDVMYSFGPPTYSHTQFVHKSGLVLAQIIANEVVGEACDFLLLPNRLAASKLSASSKHTDTESPENVIKAFKTFCRDEEGLRHFYAEVDKPKPPGAPSPLSNAFTLDSDVPSLSLPPHLSHRAQLRGL
ncbi:Vacuolar membrane-associated protein iml1 [Pseudocercospora fuligena]|uniref:Vacuolar membrane-associated protein IML1 n=1 Tax=Pseudocercospora fuligena TaxID=685502 RepID=A0A8H6RLU7_9PEZI|nr:Vacuolar membrane-associated protein iml1 [Pseudocercospora fuligena]